MKILIQSCLFSPSVGGTETATRLLAKGLGALGHEVKVVTEIEGPAITGEGYELHRRPPASTYLRLMNWCDIFVQSNLSLRNIWPLFFYRRPWIVVHHTLLEPEHGGIHPIRWLKKWTTRFATNFAVSRFMAESLPSPSIVVGNPYADDVFRVYPENNRDIDFIIVARLNEDKGIQVAVEALYRLHQRGYTGARMTIVGEGPYGAALRALVQARQLNDFIEFTGIQAPQDLAKTFNRHRILIVPSVTSETFGLVAVEGMASGCMVAASDVGSLRETVGPCGLTFPAGDIETLANFLQIHLDRPEARQSYLKAAPAHLEQFKRAQVIPVYVGHFQATLAGRKGHA